MDKTEAKKRMTCELWQYVTEKEVLEALVRQDSAKLDKIKALCSRLDVVNSKMKADVDAADDATFKKLVGEFKYPTERLK